VVVEWREVLPPPQQLSHLLLFYQKRNEPTVPTFDMEDNMVFFVICEIQQQRSFNLVGFTCSLFTVRTNKQVTKQKQNGTVDVPIRLYHRPNETRSAVTFDVGSCVRHAS
jgi:hypothetical protein